MKKYVVGFIFDSNIEHILLINKNRPAWQNGFVNGLGGKIEDGESITQATVREIKEECGLLTDQEKWIHIGQIYSDVLSVDFLSYVYEGRMDDAQSLTDEKVEWFPLNDLPKNIIKNLSWLIPITLDKINNQEMESFKVKYTDTLDNIKNK